MSKSEEPAALRELIDGILDRLEQEAGRPLVREFEGADDVRVRLQGMLAEDPELALRLFAIVLGQRIALEKAEAKLTTPEIAHNVDTPARPVASTARRGWLEWLIGPPPPRLAEEAARVPHPSHRLAFGEPADLHLTGATQGERPSSSGSVGGPAGPLLKLAYAVAGSALIGYLYDFGSAAAAYSDDADGEDPGDMTKLLDSDDGEGDDGGGDNGAEVD